MDDNILLELTADIVSAHVSHNSVVTEDLPHLIHAVYKALAETGRSEPAAAETPEPKVSIRSSVKPDAITCLECGASMKMSKRHLGSDHDISPAAYRTRWGLPADFPMVAPNYSARRRDLAKSIGLGRKVGARVGNQRATVAADAK